MKGYKGFDKNLKCREKQYEIGKTEIEDSADLCNSGMHFCEYPLDCFAYYPPSDSRYCEVDADEVSDQRDNDSKRSAKKLTIGAEIGLSGIINAGVKFILEKARTENRVSENTGYQSAATNTGDRSAATNTGNWSAATNTGYRSAATNTGNWSAATNTGDRSAATNTGYRSAATNTGDRSAATVSGKNSVAVSTGRYGKARGEIGCAIVLCEYDDDGTLLRIRSEIVDGEKIKANTFYTLKNGSLVNADDLEED